MRNLLTALCAVWLLTACVPMSLNKSADVTIQSVLLLSSEIDMAEQRGWIDNATEDELQNDLIQVLNIIQSGYTAVDVQGCGGFTDQECMQRLLLKVEMRLREAEE